jgi:hypothetical protein
LREKLRREEGDAIPMAQSSKRMLEGYRILDFTQVLAGPTRSRYMAEVGGRCRQGRIRADRRHFAVRSTVLGIGDRTILPLSIANECE